MGKVKAMAMHGEEFAQEHYNVDRSTFIDLAIKEFGTYSIEYRAAVEHWDKIQQELDDYWDEQAWDNYYDNPESPLYCDGRVDE